MARACNDAFLIADPVLSKFGMDVAMIGKGVSYTYEVLDSIDAKLLESGGSMLSELLELANLSAIIGNLFRGGIVKASEGRFKANTPHTYPDLLGVGAGCKNVEIKVALETNKPKGHLIKAGPHLTVRYVLGSADGTYLRGKKIEAMSLGFGRYAQAGCRTSTSTSVTLRVIRVKRPLLIRRVWTL